MRYFRQAQYRQSQHGSVLVIMVGMSAILLSLALVFIKKVSSDVSDITWIQKYAQARIMMYAALNYIQESGRLGWNNETYGWTDVRDGSSGPRDRTEKAMWSILGVWPGPGGVVRCPMYIKTKPPYAIQSKYAWNPIFPKPQKSWPEAFVSPNAEIDSRRFARFGYADPQIAYGSITQTEFINGDSTPIISSVELSWFRIYREKTSDHDGVSIGGNDDYDTIDFKGQNASEEIHSLFIITCGAGATNGYRDWSEVEQNGAQVQFNNDNNIFNLLRSQEVIFWFRVEWTPFVNAGRFNTYYNDAIAGTRGGRSGNPQAVAGLMKVPYRPLGPVHVDGVRDTRQKNFSLSTTVFSSSNSTIIGKVSDGETARYGDTLSISEFGRQITINMLGTFRWIQRLDREPPRW